MTGLVARTLVYSARYVGKQANSWRGAPTHTGSEAARRARES